MALNIKVSSSDWIDLRARGFVAGMYLVNQVGAPIEYSTAATPAAGSAVQGSSAVQVNGTYLWVRGFGDCELYTAAEWSAANAKTVPLTATISDGGVGDLVVGDQKLSVLARPGVNRLLKIQPTRVAIAYNEAGVAQYESTLAGESVVERDDDYTDPTTGLPMLKLTVPVGEAGVNEIRWNNFAATVSADDDDVWMFTFWVDDSLSSATVSTLKCTLRLSQLGQAPLGTSFRDFPFTALSIRPGLNVLTVKNTELYIGAATYGVLGTSSNGAWSDGATVQRGTVNSAYLRIEGASAGFALRIGSLHKAPAGWCKSAVMWSADDVPHSFLDLAIPIIESYGWQTTLNAVSVYTGRGTGSHISLPEYRALITRGHEVWGHTMSHIPLTTGTQAEKERQVAECAKYFKANGLPTAAKFFSYPELKYDATAMQILAAKGYRIARGGNGRFHSSWVPGTGQYCVGSLSTEAANPWQTDAAINGCILRGQAMFSYMHTTVPGGAGINAYPGPSQHYADHLRRWCDLVKAHEEAGRVECFTYSGYFRAVGINPDVDAFI